MIFALIEALKTIQRSFLSSLLVVLMVCVALFLGGWFAIFTLQLEYSSAFIEDALEVEMFLKEDAGEAELTALEEEFDYHGAVKSFTYISKDSAAAIFFAEVGEQIEKLTGENPLPPSYRLKLTSETFTENLVDSFLDSMTEMDGVDEVFIRNKALLSLISLRKSIMITHFAIGFIVILSALFVVINIIRISITHRRRSIEIMKLIGATNRFIRAPFLIEGLILGISGGALSASITFFAQKYLRDIFDLSISVHPYFLGALVFAGVVIGLAGSLLGIRRFL